MQLPKYLLTTLLVAGFTASTGANEIKLTNNNIELKSSLYGDSLKMTVTGPEGFNFSDKRSGGDSSISIDEIQAYNDGVYQYEFVEVKIIGEREVVDEFNGRGKSIQKIVKSKTVSGHFRVEKGLLVDNSLEEEPVKNSESGLQSNN